MEDQALAEKMPLLHIPLKSSTGRIHFNVNLKWRKKIYIFLGIVETPQIVCGFPNHHPHPWATGRAGAAAGFIQRVGTDFKGPSSRQNQDFAIPIFSHGLNSWDICRTVEGVQRESSQILCGTSGVTSLLGVSLPLSITTRVLFLHNTHIFCVDMRKHLRKCSSCPSSWSPAPVVFDRIKRHRWVLGLCWDSSRFQHAHIVSVKGQAAR